MIAPVVDVDICLGREYGYWNPARCVDARVSTKALPGCLHPERARYRRGMCRACADHEQRWGRYHLYPTRVSGRRGGR